MKMMTTLTTGLLATLLLSGPVLGGADDDVCAPFMDGMVDESLLASMLSAADKGHLFRIDSGSSRVGFCVDSKLSRIEGSFTEFRGGMALETDEPANGQTLVLIRAGSIETDSHIVKTMMLGEGFFDVENHPEVLFVSHGFEWKGKDRAELSGDLTIRGIKRPVIFEVKLTAMDDNLNSNTDKILVKATTIINRSDFGMKSFSSMVDKEVQLCMSVEAQKYRA